MNASITLYLFLKNVPTINFILQILSFAVSLRKGGRSHVTAIFCVWSAAILLVLYLLFALIHRQTTIHYLRFILLLISTFLMVLVSKYCKNHGPSTLKR